MLAGKTTSNVDRTFGVESVQGSGIRFLGINSHNGMLNPRSADPRDQAVRYALAAQSQAMEFLATAAIDDSDPIFDVVLPP